MHKYMYLLMCHNWSERAMCVVYTCTFMQHWTKLKVSGAKPPARSVHAACCMAGPLTGQQHSLLLVVGGYNNRDVLGDVWLLDIDKGIWTEVSTISYQIFSIFSGLTKAAGSYSTPVCTSPLAHLKIFIKTYNAHGWIIWNTNCWEIFLS